MIKRSLFPVPLLFLSLTLFVQLPTRAANTQQNQGSYTHKGIPTINKKKINEETLKKELLKLSQNGIATAMGGSTIRQKVLLHWLYKVKKQLQKDSIDLILKYSDCKKGVYFFVGATGCGKSTTIYALQGNEVTPKFAEIPVQDDRLSEETESSSDDDNWDAKAKAMIGLEFQKKIKGKVPKIGDSAQGETNRSTIYYPENTVKDIAFCDTEGFLGERNNVDETEQCICAFSPFFSLKTNKINGLIFVVSKEDISAARGNSFKKAAAFVRAYFSKKLKKDLRKSVMLMITKVQDGEQEKVKKELAQIIMLSYQQFFDIGRQKAPTTQQGSEQQSGSSLAGLKTFFEMFLGNPFLSEDQINDVSNFKLDKKRIQFFDPCNQKSIKHTFKRLAKMRPLDPSSLCEFDNPLFQYISKQILEISRGLYQAFQKVVQQKRKTLILMIKTGNDNDAYKQQLDELKKDLKEEQKELQDKNKMLKQDETLECVFRNSHKEYFKFPSYYVKPSTEMNFFSRMLHEITLPVRLIFDRYNGYLTKRFIYEGKEPIARIEATYSGNLEYVPNDWSTYFKEMASSSHYFNNNFLRTNFNIRKTDADWGTTFVAEAKNKNIVQDRWQFKHTTGFGKDANCRIEMWAKINELSATKQKIEDNIDNMHKIQYDLDGLLAPNEDKDVVELKCNLNKDKLKEVQQGLIAEYSKLVNMLCVFHQHFFKINSADANLLLDYIKSFEKATNTKIYYPPAPNNQQNKPLPINAPLLEEKKDDDDFDNTFQPGASGYLQNDPQGYTETSTINYMD